MTHNDFATYPLWYIAFLLSITCHEAAHAFAAKLGGDDTAYEGGQVTLDPRPHMRREPIGTVIVPILTLLTRGFPLGWASAPYDPYWADRFPKRAAWMSLAGPSANLALAIGSGLLIHFGIFLGYFDAPFEISETQLVTASNSLFNGAAKFLSILFSMNVFLWAFNLLPIPPLDGISVLGLIIPEDKARPIREAAKNPNFAFLGLFVAWQVFPWISEPLFMMALRLLYPSLTYS